MVLCGCLKLLGRPGEPCRGHWGHFLCTEVSDADKARHSCGQAGGMRANGEGWVSRTHGLNGRQAKLWNRESTPRDSLDS